jgi:hypothetical protein
MHIITTSTLILDAGRQPFTPLHNIPKTSLPSCADALLGDSKKPDDAREVSGSFSLATAPTGPLALNRVRTINRKVGLRMLARRNALSLDGDHYIRPTLYSLQRPSSESELKRVRTVSGKVGRQMLERRKAYTAQGSETVDPPTPVTVDTGNSVLKRVRTVSGKVGRQILERRKAYTAQGSETVNPPTPVSVNSVTGDSVLERAKAVFDCLFSMATPIEYRKKVRIYTEKVMTSRRSIKLATPLEYTTTTRIFMEKISVRTSLSTPLATLESDLRKRTRTIRFADEQSVIWGQGANF